MSAICSYFEIKSDVLSSYWAGCRDKGTKGSLVRMSLHGF